MAFPPACYCPRRSHIRGSLAGIGDCPKRWGWLFKKSGEFVASYYCVPKLRCLQSHAYFLLVTACPYFVFNKYLLTARSAWFKLQKTLSNAEGSLSWLSFAHLPFDWVHEHQRFPSQKSHFACSSSRVFTTREPAFANLPQS